MIEACAGSTLVTLEDSIPMDALKLLIERKILLSFSTGSISHLERYSQFLSYMEFDVLPSSMTNS